jgi:uncharacterized protein (TIGR02217 family)
MNPFVHERFPEDISYGSVGGPEYSTGIIRVGSGHEFRNQHWSEGLYRWNVIYGVRHADDVSDLLAFFHARRGRSVGFLYKDWRDYIGTGEQIGVGDAAETEFQLVKTYDPGGVDPYIRIIRKPIGSAVRIYFDTVEQISGWTIDVETGIVTFSSPPGDGVVITADYEFDVPARFDVDHLPATEEFFDAASINDVPVVALRLD